MLSNTEPFLKYFVFSILSGSKLCGTGSSINNPNTIVNTQTQGVHIIKMNLIVGDV